MKAHKTLTLPKKLVTLIERDAWWSTYCPLKPVELKRVDYVDGRTGYIVTIRIGTCTYDLYTADIDLGVCKTNRDLVKAFCLRVEAHLARFADTIDIDGGLKTNLDLAEWYAQAERIAAMDYAVKCYQENPLTWREEAIDTDEKESCSVRGNMEKAAKVFEEIRKFVAILKAHRDDHTNN